VASTRNDAAYGDSNFEIDALIAKLRPAGFSRRQWSLLLVDDGQLPRFLGIFRHPVQLALAQIGFRDNCLDRTDGNARHAIDADIIVDVDHSVVGMKAGDRAYRDAFGETAKLTIVGYHNGHKAKFPPASSVVLEGDAAALMADPRVKEAYLGG